MFPKVYKEGDSSRLVVSSIDCHTTKISKYIDHQQQQHIKALNQFSTNTYLLYPLKTSKSRRFSYVFRGDRSETLVQNGLSCL